jgi:peptidoglycan biosynthesis protein MviN/MurJ (putative lipid II flippase)
MAQSIKKITSYLFILRFLRMLISVVSVTYTAKFFGVSVEKDMWVLASTFISTLISMFWGPLDEIFRTKFIYIKEQDGEKVALDKTSSLIGFVFTVTLFMGLCIGIFHNQIANLITSNMSNGSTAILAKLLICLIPSLLITELTNISISVLNAYEVYYLPEIVAFFSGILNIVAIIIFAPSLGIYALLIAQYFGIVFLMVLIVHFLYKKHIPLWGRLFNYNIRDAWTFIVFSLPLFFPYFVGQLNTFVQKYIAGILGSGMISSVDYANQFMGILQSVLTSVLTTVMLPMLSKAYITNKKSDFVDTLKENFKIGMLLYGMAAIFMVGATTPLCTFFFYRGKVSYESLQLIINLTKYFGVAFIGIFMYLMGGTALVADNQRKFYATVGVVNQIVVLFLNVTLVRVLGVYIFPISVGIVHFISGLIMFLKLDINGKKDILSFFLRGIIVILIVTFIYNLANPTGVAKHPFEVLVINFGTLAVSMPLMALMMGMNVKNLIIRIYNKYIIRRLS